MKREQKSMGNKGFSLVELIIVIAIMAILVAVLAPQYLKYVERSRNSTDASNATEVVTALQTYAADPDATVSPSASKVTITVNATGLSYGSDSFTQNALTNAGLSNATSITCKSKTNWTEYTISYEVAADGGLTITYGGTAFNAYMTTGKVSGS